MFDSIYRGRRVLITGHSGFKGSHLAGFLIRLGAEVCGYSLPPPTEPSHFALLGLPMPSVWGDIRDAKKMRRAFLKFRPEIVFHLAAQPLVRASYVNPVETFEINVQGTCNVLEICRNCESVRAVVIVTSDKCYENRERPRGYRETDPMGGFDPYSASKGCAELVTAAYRRSFFPPEEFGKTHRVLLASARAGNVIGGGDWAADRLVPDLMRAAAEGRREEIRRPEAVRPWQHVLDPLSGYLLLGQKLLEGRKTAASGWNFGPEESGAVTVGELADKLRTSWRAVDFDAAPRPAGPHEAHLLTLNCRKAARRLHWRPVLTLDEAVAMTAGWYRDFYADEKINTAADLERYLELAAQRDAIWTKVRK